MPRPLVLLSMLALACGGDGGTPPAVPAVARLELLGVPTASRHVGDSVVDVRVRALDAEGRPVAGAGVAFRASGQSRIAASSATTDAAGVARAGTWRLGTTPTTDTLFATSGAIGTFAAVPVAVGLVFRLDVTETPGPGTVGVPVAAAFRAVDSYGNVVPGQEIELRTRIDGQAGAGRVPTVVQTDAAGVARVTSWVPRVLGTQVLTARVLDEWAESAEVSLSVTAPACAPDRLLRIVPSAPGPAATGTLNAVPSRPCADTIHRRAVVLGTGEAAPPSLLLVTTGVPVRVQRLGMLDEAGLVVPSRAPGSVRVMLPLDEDFEVVMGPRGTGANDYSVRLLALEATDPPGATCDTTWVAPGAPAVAHLTGCAVAEPAEFPAGSSAAVFGVVAAGLPGRTLTVTATTSGAGAAPPVIVVWGRTRVTGARQLLAAARSASPHTLAVPVPAGVDDVVVLVGRRPGETGSISTRIR